jgi:hypothetical protein
VLESRTVFEVTDGEFVDGVTTVIGVQCHYVTVTVGDVGVVAVGGKECGPGVVQLGASNYETMLVSIRGFGDPASPLIV